MAAPRAGQNAIADRMGSAGRILSSPAVLYSHVSVVTCTLLLCAKASRIHPAASIFMALLHRRQQHRQCSLVRISKFFIERTWRASISSFSALGKLIDTFPFSLTAWRWRNTRTENNIFTSMLFSIVRFVLLGSSNFTELAPKPQTFSDIARAHRLLASR